MRTLSRLLARIRNFLLHRRGDDRLREELEQHLALLTEENLHAGLPPAEARRQALLKLGAVEAIREHYHTEEGIPFFEHLFGDTRYSLRVLLKSPGFTVVAILTLAFGIGANAIVFSVLNALILRPLNVPNAQSLYTLERGAAHWPSQSYRDYRDLRDRNRSFESLIAYNIMGSVGLDTGGTPSVMWPYLTSGNYFDALGIQPYLGRFFHASDEKGTNSAPWIVLSYDYWHAHFHADTGIIGRQVQINKHPFTIIGVAPPGFRGTELFFVPDVWLPLVDQPEVDEWNGLDNSGAHFLWVSGHLKPGVSPSAATADLNTLAAAMAKADPKDDDRLSFALGRPGLVGDFLGGPTREFLGGLMLLAGLILLAACANLGSLFAARAADRSREIAVRLALGSRRALILRQLLTEAILVSLAGGALGLLGGIAILRWLSAWRPIPDIPINVPVHPDLRTWAVALLLALLSGLLFGLVPVRQVLRSDPYQTIRSGSVGLAGSRRFPLRDLLLAGQIAICAVLVTASLVAVRGLVRSLHSNFGFSPDHVMAADVDLHMAGYSPDQAGPMQRRMRDALAAIPGVSSVAYASNLPLQLGGGNDSSVFRDNVTDYRVSNAAVDADEFDVSPGYFQTAGTVLLAGRTFTWHDDAKSPRVAVVNEEFARKVFGSVQKAIGSDFKIWAGLRVQVVGVTQQGKYATLAETPHSAMFFPILQQKDAEVIFLLRSERDPRTIAGATEQTLHGIDPSLPLSIETWNRSLDSALFPSRVATVALGVLGLLGAMLAVTGIFGMASYVVSRRLREIGIRVALGANQREVLSAALGRAFRLLALGSGAGLLLGLLATKLLSYIVYQATPKDPFVLAGVIATMLLLGLAATWIPARRALAVDPMILLREQ
ncbi:MAG: ABC transporter permease [Acidobacteriaceae bacterium]